MSFNVQENHSLKHLNTFGFDQRAEYFVSAGTEAEIEQAVQFAKDKDLPVFVLGEGSNVVLASDIAGLVLQLTDQHISIHVQNANTAQVSVGAGVNWHALVQHTLANDIRGLENLSLIPGSAGAAPVQNIGAYGVEVKDRISQLRAFHIPTMQWQTWQASQCEFSYRNSIFKQRADEYIISQVEFTLGKQHALQMNYATLAQHLHTRHLAFPNAQEISESVIAIRQARLPDPARIGNAGSFFHNPIVDADQHQELLARYPKLPCYPQKDGSVKLAAGWLIDNLGFKGLVKNGVGVHREQALVLINTGTGNGADILELAFDIQAAVLEAYGVRLRIEPRVVDTRVINTSVADTPGII